MKKTVACIIARTNSTRLPQKVLRDVGGITLIEYIIAKVKKSKLVDEIFLCTSIDEGDKVLLEIAKKNNIEAYAGSLDSVIDRMLDVAEIADATDVIRITGDNIFTDETYLDIMINQHLIQNAEYTRTENLPIGITSEVIKVEALKKCYALMNPDESQYLMLYMFQPSIFKCLVVLPVERHNRPNYTLTVDTPEDFERTLSILQKDELLSLDEVLDISEKNEVNNLIYEGKGIVKLPANLTIYFDTYRKEMDLRVKNSMIYQVEQKEYLQTKNNQERCTK